MPESRYDVVFSGQLVAGADAATVRLALQTQFKLTDALLDRLFSGQRVAIKRGLELPLAQRYCELFAQAGAVLQVVEMPPPAAAAAPIVSSAPVPPAPAVVETAPPVPSTPVSSAPIVSSAPVPPAPAAVETAAPATFERAASPAQFAVTASPVTPPVSDEIAADRLSLAPVGSALEELTDSAAPRNPNTSHLSLIAGQDWTLEDCAPPPLAQPLPDIDSLTLEPLAPVAARRDELE